MNIIYTLCASLTLLVTVAFSASCRAADEGNTVDTAAGKGLNGKKIAILVANNFEEVEMTGPREALQNAGAQAVLISPQPVNVKSAIHDKPGHEFPIDVPLSSANPADYDALLLPGGVANPDTLRINPEAVEFVKSFVTTQKPIAAICHGPWTLIEAGGVKNKTMTSWPSLKTDLQNAGAHWVDQEVAVDQNLVTSRKPDDIPAFNKRFIALLEGQPHSSRK